MRSLLDIALAEAGASPNCDLNSVNVEIDPVNLM
jgi:hypothetical protein